MSSAHQNSCIPASSRPDNGDRCKKMAAKHPQPGSPQPRSRSLGKQALRLGGLALLLASLPGCQSIQATSNNVAELRVINASPDAGGGKGLDFYLNNTALVYSVGFGKNTNHTPVAPGTYTVYADQGGTTQTLISSGVTLGNGQAKTVLVGNFNASLEENILTDQTTPAPGGEAAFRFLDQNTSVGAVDIYLVPSGGKLITTLPFLQDITFDTNTGYVTFPDGTYAINIVPTGTVPIATTVTLYSGPQVSYGSGAVSTVLLLNEVVTSTPAIQVNVINDLTD